jgi:hypothetical protein
LLSGWAINEVCDESLVTHCEFGRYKVALLNGWAINEVCDESLVTLCEFGRYKVALLSGWAINELCDESLVNLAVVNFCMISVLLCITLDNIILSPLGMSWLQKRR